MMAQHINTNNNMMIINIRLPSATIYIYTYIYIQDERTNHKPHSENDSWLACTLYTIAHTCVGVYKPNVCFYIHTYTIHVWLKHKFISTSSLTKSQVIIELVECAQRYGMYIQLHMCTLTHIRLTCRAPNLKHWTNQSYIYVYNI